MTKEINEVSNVTLNNYAVKAKKEISDRQFGRKERDPAKMKKRASGVKQAKEKLAKSRAKLTKEDVIPLLLAAASKSALDFSNIFETLITDKITDLVESYEVEIASTLLDEASAVKAENKFKKNLHATKIGQKIVQPTLDGIKKAGWKVGETHADKKDIVRNFKKVGRSELNK